MDYQSCKQNAYKRSNRCPSSAGRGFTPEKPAWFYLLERPGEQQLGITNNIPSRFRRHASNGWVEIQKTGPHSGHDVYQTEKIYKRWLRKEVGLIPGTIENWSTLRMEVHSLAELKEKSGIETSIFQALKKGARFWLPPLSSALV